MNHTPLPRAHEEAGVEYRLMDIMINAIIMLNSLWFFKIFFDPPDKKI